MRSLYLSSVAGSQFSCATSLAGSVGSAFQLKVQIEGRTIFCRNRPSVSSCTIASGWVKSTRTFHASDRDDMGATVVHIAWELAMMFRSKSSFHPFQTFATVSECGTAQG